MTFGSKHGRRTSTEDLYREVLQRWQKCVTTLILMYFCGALVLSDSVSMKAPPKQDTEDSTTVVPAMRGSSRRESRFREMLPKLLPIPRRLPVNLTDLMSNVRQVSVSAKDCAQQQQDIGVSNATAFQVESVAPKHVGNITIKPDAAVTSSSSSAKLNTSSRHLACPHQLPYSGVRNLNQCLYLDELSVEEACRPSMRNQVHLRFCAQYNLGHLLPEGDVCGPSFLGQVRELDEAAKLLACQFENLLQLYDCDTSYSVSWSCRQCRIVYRQWVCAMVLPFHLNGQLLKPCRSVCRLVEQICPYFHPNVKEQYAGERVFKCIDPDIPDLDSISVHSMFGQPGHCHCPHHLESSTEAIVPDVEECKLSRSALHYHRRPGTTTTTTTTTSTVYTPATNSSTTEVGGKNTSSSSVTGTTKTTITTTNSTGAVAFPTTITTTTTATVTATPGAAATTKTALERTTTTTSGSDYSYSGTPSSGTSSACVSMWLLLALLTFHLIRTSGFIGSGKEPT